MSSLGHYLGTDTAPMLTAAVALDIATDPRIPTAPNPPSVIHAASGSVVIHTGDVVVRVSSPGRSTLDVWSQKALVDLLGTSGVPLAPALDAWTTSDGLEVTLLGYVDNLPNTPVPTASLGRALAALHAVDPFAPTRAGVNLPGPEDWLDRLRRRASGIAAQPGYGTVGADFIQVLRILESRFVMASAGVPAVVSHGDVGRRNILVTPAASVVLCDWESVRLGPAWWDLAAPVADPATGRSGWGDLDELFSAYGEDPRGHELFEVLWRLRALSATLFRVREYISGTLLGESAPSMVAWFYAEWPHLGPGPAALPLPTRVEELR